MAISDPIADLLTRIRNSISAEHKYVDVDDSKLKLAILKILKEQGFIENFLHREALPQGVIRIFLKYVAGRRPLIKGLKRISKPGGRRYVKHQEIPRVLRGMGISILSTSQGLMIGEEARQKKLGGEVLCFIW